MTIRVSQIAPHQLLPLDGYNQYFERTVLIVSFIDNTRRKKRKNILVGTMH